MSEVVETKVGLYPATLEKIDRIQRDTNTQTKADALRRAVDLTCMVLDEMENGGYLCVERLDRSRWELKLAPDADTTTDAPPPTETSDSTGSSTSNSTASSSDLPDSSAA